MWEYYVPGCHWDGNLTDPNSCHRLQNISTVDGYEIRDSAPSIIDSTYVFAYALDALINEHCLNLTGDKLALRECVSSHDLLSYMKKVHFQGHTSKITFDEQGDIYGRYIIENIHLRDGVIEFVQIGYWDRKDEILTLNRSLIDWSVFIGAEQNKRGDIPESVCSKPCSVGEIHLPQDLPCCWICRACRENEITIRNYTRCEKCPMFHWPIEDHHQSCEPITASYLEVKGPIGISLFAVNIGLLIGTTTTCILFFKYRNEKLIKASSKDLCTIILLGSMVSLIAVIFTIQKPTDFW